MSSWLDGFEDYLEEECFRVEELRDRLDCVLAPESVIRPKPIILSFSKTEMVVEVLNAFTFVRSKRPRQITRVIRNHFDRFFAGDDFSLSIYDERDSLGLKIEFSTGISESFLLNLINFYSEAFTEVLFSYRDYSLSEFRRIGVTVFGEDLILVLASFRELDEAIKYESNLMTKEFLTRPDDEGVYLSSSSGFDYLNFPLLSIASRKQGKFIFYAPSKEGEGLVAVDLVAELRYILENLPDDFRDEEKELVEGLNELLEKPYLILAKIDVLRELERKLGARRENKLLDIISREVPTTITRPATMSFFMFGTEREEERKESVEEVLKRLRGLIDNLEMSEILESKLRKMLVNRIISGEMGEAEMIFSGKVVSEKQRKLHRFGGGLALYLSREEIQDILGEDENVRIIFLRDKSGKKRIIIESTETED